MEQALLAGDAETGVCVMAMEEGLDTGGVYRRAATFIEETDTLASLRDRLVQLGVELLLDCLQHGFGPAEPQHGEAVYAAKIDPAELHLDFARPTVELLRTISLGRTWTTLRSKRLLVHRAVAAEPALVRAAGSPGPGELAVAGEAVLVGTADGALQLPRGPARGTGPPGRHRMAQRQPPQPGELLGR
ncbi:MAG: formyltransferase family protein [Acidimicrobiales bacterium]